MSKFDRNRIKDGGRKTLHKQTDRHYKNNGHLAVNQFCLNVFWKSSYFLEICLIGFLDTLDIAISKSAYHHVTIPGKVL